MIINSGPPCCYCNVCISCRLHLHFIIIIYIQENKLIDQKQWIRNSIKNNILSKPPQRLDHMYFQHLFLSISIGRYMCVIYWIYLQKIYFSRFLPWKVFVTIDSNGDNTLCGMKYYFTFTSVLSLKESAVTCELPAQRASCMQWVVSALDRKRWQRYNAYYKIIYALLSNMHFKTIVLEIVMKSKSEEKIQLAYTYSLPPPPPKKTQLRRYGFVEIFHFNKIRIFAQNLVLMSTFLQAAGNHSEKLAENPLNSSGRNQVHSNQDLVTHSSAHWRTALPKANNTNSSVYKRHTTSFYFLLTLPQSMLYIN